jgi:hypothetical protein
MNYFAIQDTQGSRLLFVLTSFHEVALREQAARSQQASPEQQPPVTSLPITTENDSNDPNDPMGILLGQRSAQGKHTAASPIEVNRPTSNLTKASPASPATLKRTPSYPTHDYTRMDSRNNSLKSLDTFFDLARVSSSSHSGGSENNDPLDTEIDFETLWQWPNFNSTGMTPALGVSDPFEATAGIMEPAIAMESVQGNVPLFGVASTDFGGS